MGFLPSESDDLLKGITYQAANGLENDSKKDL